MIVAQWAADHLGQKEAPLLCLSITQCPARSHEIMAVSGNVRTVSSKRALGSGMKQIWTCPMRRNLTTPMIRQSGYDRLCQIAAGENPTLMALLPPQAPKRILALNLSSILMVLSPVMHGYQYLQLSHPQTTPLTTFSPSSPVFLSHLLPLIHVSAGPSLSLSSCVSKTHTGEQG